MTTDEYLAERGRIVGILKARRKELGLTQRALGRKIWHQNLQAGRGYRQRTWEASINRWETGAVTPRMNKIIEWADALGLRVRFEMKGRPVAIKGQRVITEDQFYKPPAEEEWR